MPSLDTATLINWVVSVLIGLVFGIGSAWVTHRYQRQRDDIAWEREKTKLREQFEHEKRLLELQFQQRLKELEQQSSQQQSSRVRDEILKGVDDPDKTIEELQRARRRIYTPPQYTPPQHRDVRRESQPIYLLVMIVMIMIISTLLVLLPILQK